MRWFFRELSYILGMSLKQIIAPSVLNANFLELGKGLNAIKNGGAGLVHLDIPSRVNLPRATRFA